MAVVLDAGGDLRRLRRLWRARFTAAVRRELPRWGATRPCLRIVGAVFDALTDPSGSPGTAPAAWNGPSWYSRTGSTPGAGSPTSRPGW